ncbi:SUMO1 sentrin specific peptidase 8 [Tritrichomonas musculus]|uniref:SUMO1 sentrin specific peptidase 8 n=1 Tax=Tritrichomonas musculus TaxID=1915356 RepID=A0ABR2KJC2_9EUKA
MTYEKAKIIYNSLLQENFSCNGSLSGQITINDIDAQREFYEKLIEKWIDTTHVIKFNARKLSKILDIDDSNSMILSILCSDPSTYQISDDKFISKRNLENFCSDLVGRIELDAESILDLYKTESELSEVIANYQKKSIISFVLDELKNGTYDVKIYSHLGYVFPSKRYSIISKDKAQAILNAKIILNSCKENKIKGNEHAALCESFLSNVQIGEICPEVCQKINKIHPSIQFIPNSISNIGLKSSNDKFDSKSFRLSKSSSNLSDYPITFKDIDIYLDDFKSLQDQNWINDKIIHFYGRIIESEHDDVFFIPPPTVQYIRFVKSKEVAFNVTNWNLTSYSIVFIPFTNSDSLRNIGNHWSLLVWFPKHQNLFYHCDSFQQFDDSSLKSAKLIVKRLISICKLRNHSLKQKHVPQQNNNYDCGLYLLAYIEFLVEKRSFQGMEDVITQENITSMRSSIKRKILNFKDHHI